MLPIELFGEKLYFLRKADYRKCLGIIFLGIQLALVAQARFIPERYFCWAPHDMQTEFELTVFVNGRELNANEIARRFQINKKDRDARAVANVKDVIRQHAGTYGKNDESLVIMNYTINGIPQEPWQWHHRPQKK
jgi:hypothetical protein